ncbi:MAG: hypothetical protein SNJ79_09230 [Sphingomonadaceae bacterium]
MAGDELLDCDLVMRGGATSGLVYPGTLVTLAERYRFRCIGGASAGAIAAGIAAAAEIGRRSGSYPNVYPDLVGKVSEELGAIVDGESRLKTLFHPSTAMRPVMEIAWATLEKGPVDRLLVRYLARVTGRTLRAAAATAAAVGLTGAILGAMVATALAGAGSGPFLIACLLMLLGAATLAAAALPFWFARGSFVSDLGTPLSDLAASGFGLCPGVNPDVDASSTREMADRGGFADWMHATIQRAAGREVTDPPVAVSDLWGTSDPWAPDRRVDLVLTTTNLTQQLPHQFPFLERSSSFLYFAPQDLANALPASVIEHLLERRDPAFDIEQDGVWYHRLPRPADLPVLLGVRLSMSFPFLISAVKLHECAAFRTGSATRPHLAPCWFSDGGITSNFPVATFDAPLPARPTFCINLADLPRNDPDRANRVRMVNNNSEGVRAPLRSDMSQGGLVTFLGAIVDTARNGRENEQMTLPSQRDRIVTVLLDPDKEGGLNLNMQEATLKQLSAWGAEAGTKLVQRFHPAGGGDPQAPEMTWNLHRWGRIRTTFAGLEALALRVDAGWRRADASGRTVPEILHLSKRFRNYPWGSSADWERACAAADRLAADAAWIDQAARPRPQTSVFDGTKRGPTSRGRDYDAPRPTLRFQLGPVGLDPRRS